MKKSTIILFAFLLPLALLAGNIEKIFTFGDYTIRQTGTYQTISFINTKLSGIPGEPVLPYQAVSLMLPPGEVAESIEITGEEETIIPGSFMLYPNQGVRPISKPLPGQFIRNEEVYQRNTDYPAVSTGHLMTQYLNGYAFALSTFTPIKYDPSTGKLSFFQKVTVRIKTHSGLKSTSALKNLTVSSKALSRVRNFAQNQEMMAKYPAKESLKSSYQMLIITPQAFQSAFQPLIDMYSTKSIAAQIKTTEDIAGSVSGIDLQEQIRNYIVDQYQNSSIEYVLLGGSPPFVPSRSFVDTVYYGPVYGFPTTDSIEESSLDIPADLYYSGMDGNYNANSDSYFGEYNDDPDYLPDVAVARMPAASVSELNNMIHKSISYQTNPVFGEQKRPLLVGEYLYDAPETLGGDYMDLLVDDHSDNGYFTNGIPSAKNTITRLYDTATSPGNYYSWDAYTLIDEINQGKSFIHHLGHSNYSYTMRLYTWDINNSNFSQVDGIQHNYSLLYTQGCMCGGFDQPDCIASKMLSIENFVVCGVYNSRFGWFDQGTTDGPSQHLEREFVNAMYTDTLPELHFGAVQMISKIKTAPWLNLPGEFEPGAQRWCHYDCNALGDPALEMMIDEPVGIPEKINTASFSVSPNPAKDIVTVKYNLPSSSNVTFTIFNTQGQQVTAATTYSGQAKGNHSAELNLSNLKSGTYYCRLEAGVTSRTKKVVVIR
ncbi:MAG: C25 family cysteine peptidase [Bacteroidetes bacterium]|nr:C25 family cysteine peptidase [Bacteroidota bacterium]